MKQEFDQWYRDTNQDLKPYLDSADLEEAFEAGWKARKEKMYMESWGTLTGRNGPKAGGY